ncbi:MAG: inositol monophosphatase family protein [Ilumatobacteraceae bacterium]
MTGDLAGELLTLAANLATRVGDTALAGRRLGLRNVETKSTPTDMVTEYDRATEREIVSTLQRLRPDDAIVGEEGASHDGTSGITWFVDPIDGTTNFLYDLPMWTVSIGAHDANGARCGVVYAPALREMFTAIRGGGAFLNGHRIVCSDVTDPTRALVGTGFNYSPANRVTQAKRFPQFIDKIRDVRRLGSASLDLCFVACGRYDAYFEEHLYPWDLAAGSLIAAEAGAHVELVTTTGPGALAVLAANPVLFPQIKSILLR